MSGVVEGCYYGHSRRIAGICGVFWGLNKVFASVSWIVFTCLAGLGSFAAVDRLNG